MNIGIDLDDTITDIQDDMLELAIKYDNTLRGNGIVNKDKLFIAEKFDWSKEERDYFFKNIRLKVVLKAKIRENVREVLNILKKRGYKIIVITARSFKYYKDPYKLTYKFLKSNSIPFDKLVVNSSNKEFDCRINNIKYFIDDNLDNCLNVSKLNIKVFFLDIGLYKEVSYKNIIKINNIKEVLEYIK